MVEKNKFETGTIGSIGSPRWSAYFGRKEYVRNKSRQTTPAKPQIIFACSHRRLEWNAHEHLRLFAEPVRTQTNKQMPQCHYIFPLHVAERGAGRRRFYLPSKRTQNKHAIFVCRIVMCARTTSSGKRLRRQRRRRLVRSPSGKVIAACARAPVCASSRRSQQARLCTGRHKHAHKLGQIRTRKRKHRVHKLRRRRWWWWKC